MEPTATHTASTGSRVRWRLPRHVRKAAAGAFFHVVNTRYERNHTTLVTTNRGLPDWGRSSATPPSPPRSWTGSLTRCWTPRRTCGVHRVPQAALAADLVDQPPRAREQEIKRRSNVVGIIPNDDAVVRLIGAVLIAQHDEQHDEWQVAERRYFSEESMKPVIATHEEVTPALPAA